MELAGKLSVGEMAAFDVERAEEINAKLSGQPLTKDGLFTLPAPLKASASPARDHANPARDHVGTNGAAAHSTVDAGQSGRPRQVTATDTSGGPSAMDVDSAGPCGPHEGAAGLPGETTAMETDVHADVPGCGTQDTDQSLAGSQAASDNGAPDPPSSMAFPDPPPGSRSGLVPTAPRDAPSTRDQSLAVTQQPVSAGEPSAATPPPAAAGRRLPSFSFPTSGAADSVPGELPSPDPLVPTAGTDPDPPHTVANAHTGLSQDPLLLREQEDPGTGASVPVHQDVHQDPAKDPTPALGEHHSEDAKDPRASEAGEPPSSHVGLHSRAVDGGGDPPTTPREGDPVAVAASGALPEIAASSQHTSGGTEAAEMEREPCGKLGVAPEGLGDPCGGSGADGRPGGEEDVAQHNGLGPDDQATGSGALDSRTGPSGPAVPMDLDVSQTAGPTDGVTLRD